MKNRVKNPAAELARIRTYSVEGMTCEHCALSVRAEVSEVDGVRHVDVDLASGRMTVCGDRFGDEAVGAAVAEAGYRLGA